MGDQNRGGLGPRLTRSYNLLHYPYLVCIVFGWVSLITGLEYGMELWNGKWNGIVNVQNSSEVV